MTNEGAARCSSTGWRGQIRWPSGGAFCSPSAAPTSRCGWCFIAISAPGDTAPFQVGAHGPAVCGLRLRLRVSIDPAARRRAENLPVRYLAIECPGRAIGGDRRGGLLRDPVGDRPAAPRQSRELGHRAEYLERDRPADRGRGDLLLVRGDHHQLSRQHDRKFDLDGDVPADRGRAVAAAVRVPRHASGCDRGRDRGRGRLSRLS